jgi:hypothetical protein
MHRQNSQHHVLIANKKIDPIGSNGVGSNETPAQQPHLHRVLKTQAELVMKQWSITRPRLPARGRRERETPCAPMMVYRRKQDI